MPRLTAHFAVVACAHERCVVSELGTNAVRPLLAIPQLTRKRLWFAFIVAVLTDGAQLLLGPFGWVFIDDALDVIAMILTCWALGFHVLLLPTFVIKLIPLADPIPLWTGCVAAVVALRKRAQRPPSPPPPPRPPPLPPSGGAGPETA